MTSASFDGKSGATATPAENFAITDKIFDVVEDKTVGLVVWKANTIFVTHITTANSTATNNDYTRIANANDALQNGFTIILHGTFTWTSDQPLCRRRGPG